MTKLEQALIKDHNKMVKGGIAMLEEMNRLRVLAKDIIFDNEETAIQALMIAEILNHYYELIFE